MNRSPIGTSLTLLAVGGMASIGIIYAVSRPPAPALHASTPTPVAMTASSVSVARGTGGGPPALSTAPDVAFTDESSDTTSTASASLPTTVQTAPAANVVVGAAATIATNATGDTATTPNVAIVGATTPAVAGSVTSAAANGTADGENASMTGTVASAPSAANDQAAASPSAAAVSSYAPAPYVAVPMYGAPLVDTTIGGSGATATNDTTPASASNNNAPLYTGGGGGFSNGANTFATGGGAGGTDTNAGVVNPQPSIAASFLLALGDAGSLEGDWSSLQPFLHPSDVVIANASGVGTASSFLTWADRVRTDDPLVSYVVVVPDPGTLKAVVGGGLPATLAGLGLSSLPDTASLAASATLVHGAGKRLYVAVPSNSTRLAEAGARVDLIEIILTSGSADGAGAEAGIAVNLVRAVGKPTIFVRLPESLSGSGVDAAAAANAIAQHAPGVGVSFPADVSSTVVSGLRSSSQ